MTNVFNTVLQRIKAIILNKGYLRFTKLKTYIPVSGLPITASREKGRREGGREEGREESTQEKGGEGKKEKTEDRIGI